MDEKIKMLQEYIVRADQILASNNKQEAMSFSNEVIGVYGTEIERITDRLDSYSASSYYSSRDTDYLGDVKLLKMKLLNYKNNLQAGLLEPLDGGNGTEIVVTQTSTQTTMVSVTLGQTIENIQKIQDNVLTEDEKNSLIGKLAKISAEKDKQSKWEKAKDVLKWIVDKAVEVGIAALPYIAQELGK